MASNTVSYTLVSPWDSTTSDGGLSPLRSRASRIARNWVSGGLVSSKANSMSLLTSRSEAFSIRMRALFLMCRVAPPWVRHTVLPWMANLRHCSPLRLWAAHRRSGLFASAAS